MDEPLLPRPLTVAETLDAAVTVLRRRPLRLLGLALLLAMVEQAVLWPARSALHLPTPHDYLHLLRTGDFIGLWLIIAAGLGTEAAILLILGAVAARDAVRLMFAGEPVPAMPARAGTVGITALITGAGAASATGLLGIGWVFWFGETGPVGPALSVDGAISLDSRGRRIGPFGAFARAAHLVHGAGWRPGGIRLLGYGTWLAIRLVCGLAGIAALQNFSGNAGWQVIAEYAIWIGIDAFSYAYVACLDAVCLLESRMRVEGLDITIGRARRAGTPVEAMLRVPR